MQSADTFTFGGERDASAVLDFASHDLALCSWS